jgi:hypothetical protein
MKRDLEKSEIEPPAGLFLKVLSRIEAEEKIALLKRRIFVFSGLVCASTTGLIVSFNFARNAIAESGFGEFFSLIFSDPAIVIAYWQNFFLTLLESFPIIEATIFLAVMFLLLQFIRFINKDLGIINVIRKNNQYGLQ